MKYKLIAADMDGTLLNDASQLTIRTKRAIVNAVDAGVYFVAATGRPFSNVQNVNALFTNVKIDPDGDAITYTDIGKHSGTGSGSMSDTADVSISEAGAVIKTRHEIDMPFIVFNGAAAYMGKSNKLLFERFLDFDLANEAFEEGQKLGIPQIVWTGPRLWANRRCEETSRYEKISKTSTGMTITDNLAAILGEVKGISKVLWIEKPDYIKELSVRMNKHFGEKLRCVSSLPHFLEFISIDAGKGKALAEIGTLLDIESSEMIAVGDGNNDVCMVKYAGLGVAVENATADVKAVCDYITSSNNSDGVAEVIEKYLL